VTENCPVFHGKPGPAIADPRVNEVSGITAATSIPGTVWAHNDSGDTARLFAIGWDGTVHGTVDIDGADAIDWEDMAAGPTSNGLRELWIGDVGDNHASRPLVQLYRLPEPSAADLEGRVAAIRYDIRYPDGPADCEALMVDPADGAVYFIEKNLMKKAAVYVVRPPPVPSGPIVAERVAEIRVRLATGADISADGSRIVVRNYKGAFLWQREPGQSLVDVLNGQAPCKIDVPAEPQSESIAFADSYTLLSLSEQPGQPLHVLTTPRPQQLP